ncbi:hypothetical protein VQL36_02695 [Chengkuizengella sp. SCS-71B]|uniref:hypothetical protein n=1 Tax=Chengkuizengella sp. SCS-71B TaxID=3115290 RepID=UPI0032C23B35
MSGHSSATGAAIILVLFILLVIILATSYDRYTCPRALGLQCPDNIRVINEPDLPHLLI